MASTLRFRPVLFGSPTAPTAVYYLLEASDGHVYFRDFETAWPVERALQAVTVDDLPDPYRTREAAASIAPVRTAHGATPGQAFEQMLAALRQIARHAQPGVPERSTVT